MGDLSPMEGVELEIRAQARPRLSFPVSLDSKLAEGDEYRLAKEKLEATLQDIERDYDSEEARPHQPPDCDRCLAKNQDIIRAFHEYYLTPNKKAWYHECPGWYQHMEGLFQNAKDPRDCLDRIHFDHQIALRAHLRQYLCAPHPTDSNHVSAIKNSTAMTFDQGSTIKYALEYYMSEMKAAAYDNPDAAIFLDKLQKTKTPEERAQVYINYYCAPSQDDRPEQRNFKAKYAQMFKLSASHDEVVAAMEKEPEEFQMNIINKKRRQLSELQMAQSAHLKDKAKKAEKEQRMQDRKPSPSTPMIADCGFDGCPVELDLADENFECAICEWLVAKDPASHKRRTYYCSFEHAEEDFYQHESRHHKCCMGDRCINYPNAGPPGDTEASGICQQCTREFGEEGREGQTPFFYFCSDDCYRQNLDHHRRDMHLVADRPGDFEVLEHFRPAEDMDLVS